MVNPASQTIFLINLHYWVHKTANVLNKLPTSVQPKTAVRTTWMAETRKDAEAAFDRFVEFYEANRQGCRPLQKRSRRAAGVL